MKNKDKILILDFGSQYTQLIARRVREIGVLKRRRQKANLYKGKSGKYYFKIGIMNYKIPAEYDGENLTIEDVEKILKNNR